MVSFPFRGWWSLPARFGPRTGAPLSLPVLVLGQSSSLVGAFGAYLVAVPSVARALGVAVGSGRAVSLVGARASSLVRWPVPRAGWCLVVVPGNAASLLWVGCGAAGRGPAAWAAAWAAAGPVPWSAVWPLVPGPVRAGWPVAVPGSLGVR